MDRLDPSGLYELSPDVPPLDRPVLVQALDGFVDAGNATSLARTALLDRLPSQVVAVFDHDQLHDYRARRPPMLFVEDHWETYEAPQLALHRVEDETGVPFLLLAGPEPDAQWERFTAAVQQLVEHFDVRLTVGLNAIPMALPHTRPVGVIAHSRDKELVAGYEPWIGTVQVPASAGHLIEHRLADVGHSTAGFAVHVPQYVSQADFPAASVVLLREVGKMTGLTLPLADLEAAAVRTRDAIDAQVAGSEEVAAVVAALEAQYDAFVAGRGKKSLLDADGSLLDSEGELPSADELGAELERFLAERTDP
ncbi:MAG: proteasome protein [Frankiales bacterium]|nr:proteasome protein [Frankiales bacterium]